MYVGVRNGLDAHGLLTSWGVDPSVIPEGAGEVAAAWCITAGGEGRSSANDSCKKRDRKLHFSVCVCLYSLNLSFVSIMC